MKSSHRFHSCRTWRAFLISMSLDFDGFWDSKCQRCRELSEVGAGQLQNDLRQRFPCASTQGNPRTKQRDSYIISPVAKHVKIKCRTMSHLAHIGHFEVWSAILASSFSEFPQAPSTYWLFAVLQRMKGPGAKRYMSVKTCCDRKNLPGCYGVEYHNTFMTL